MLIIIWGFFTANCWVLVCSVFLMEKRQQAEVVLVVVDRPEYVQASNKVNPFRVKEREGWLALK